MTVNQARADSKTPTDNDRVQRVSAQELLAAYPDPNPSTAGFQGRRAEVGGTGKPIPGDTSSAVGAAPLAPEDQTHATLITQVASLTFPRRTAGKIQSKPPGQGWGDGKEGSGVLVGPWHVLTASHVVTGDPAGTQYRFLPAYWDGPRTGVGFGASSADIVGFVGIHTEVVSGWDYMVCRLDRSLGFEWGWNGTKSSSNDGFYTNNLHASIGYPGNLPAGPAGGERPYENNVQIFEVDDADHDSKLLKGRSDVAGGWSGGPLIITNLSGYTDTVVGVLSGSNDGGDGPFDLEDVHFAGGPEMVRLVQYARDNWYHWVEQPEDLNTSFGYTKPMLGTGAAACSWGPGRIDLLWQSADNHLRHTWHEPNVGWGSETDMTAMLGLTPMFGHPPTVCSWAPGRLDVFWQTSWNHIRHIWYTQNGGWGWETNLTTKLGLTPGIGPAACSWAPGRLDLFYKSSDNHLRHVWYTEDGGWGWETDLTTTLGLTPISSAPAVTSWQPGRLDVLWRSPGNHLHHVWYTENGGWGWETDLTTSHGYGPATRNPAICSWAPGRLDLLWGGSNKHLYHAWYDGGWGWATDMSNKFTSLTESSTAICSWETGRLDLFWGEDTTIRHTAYTRWQ